MVWTFFRSGLFKREEYVDIFLELDDARKKKGLIKWFFFRVQIKSLMLCQLNYSGFVCDGNNGIRIAN